MKSSQMKSNKKSLWKKIEDNHPYKTLLYLSMFGSLVIFLFLLLAFTISNPPDSLHDLFQMPKAFVASTFVMLTSSMTMQNAYSSFIQNRLEKSFRFLILTLLLGVLFTILQFKGWHQLQEMGITFQGKNSGAYLFLISGLHVIHILGVLIFLVVKMRMVLKCMKDPIINIVETTNPFQKTQMLLLNRSWQFVDFLWIFLFFYFMFTF
jgi:cytochrome c oxidase subunit III